MAFFVYLAGSAEVTRIYTTLRDITAETCDVPPNQIQRFDNQQREHLNRVGWTSPKVRSLIR